MNRSLPYWLSQATLLLIAGLIGALISEWVSTSTVSLMSIVALVGITTAAIGILYIQQMAKDVSARVEKVDAVTPVVTALPDSVSSVIVDALAPKHEGILSQLDKLSRQVRFDAVYLKPADISMQYNPVFDHLRAARTEILILDQFLSDNRPDLNLGDDVLARSLDAIFELPDAEQRGGRYERVIQTPDGTIENVVQGANNVFVDHFRQVLSANNPRALLHVAPWCYSSKFTLIDGEIVILQIHHRNERTGHHEVEGELILRDPSGQLGEIFRDLFEVARARSNPIRLRDTPWTPDSGGP